MSETQEHVPTYMPTANRPINLGRTLDDQSSRLDAVAKVTGRARYGRDMHLPGTLFVAFIRCPFGSATLRSIDENAARRVPGVVEVKVTGDEGRYHGHNVGYVVAESRLALCRGLAAAAPRWKRDGVKTTIEDGAGLPPPLEKGGLWPDTGEVRLVAIFDPPQKEPSGSVHGRIQDVGGRPR